MIDLHYWTTPNGHKVTMFLEETGLPYRIVPVNNEIKTRHRDGACLRAGRRDQHAALGDRGIAGGSFRADGRKHRSASRKVGARHGSGLDSPHSRQ